MDHAFVYIITSLQWNLQISITSTLIKYTYNFIVLYTACYVTFSFYLHCVNLSIYVVFSLFILSQRIRVSFHRTSASVRPRIFIIIKHVIQLVTNMSRTSESDELWARDDNLMNIKHAHTVAFAVAVAHRL